MTIEDSVNSSVAKIIILTGPTAVGKSSIALDFAENTNKTHSSKIEIVNADSVCFYREFNIGSAKPSDEELQRVPHHLINIADPHENYHAGQFIKDGETVLKEIHARGNRALIVGGSGFYLKTLRFGLWEAPPTSPEFRETLKDKTNAELYEDLVKIDPAQAAKISVQDRYRIIRALEIVAVSGKIPSQLESEMPSHPNPAYVMWVLDRDKDELAVRMRSRIEKMIADGLIDEVIKLRDRYPLSKTLHAVGYQQVLDFLNGEKPEGRQIKVGITGLIDEIELAHRQLAKQQRTWFKNLKPNETFVLDQDQSLLKEKLMNFYQ